MHSFRSGRSDRTIDGLTLRSTTLAVLATAAVLLTCDAADAFVTSGCRKVAAARAASLYGFAARQFRNCSKAVARGGSCDTAKRDAKVSGKLAKTQASLLGRCGDQESVSQGFPDADALVVSVAGAADGEGRQVADAVFGRVPRSLSADELACADAIANEAARAGTKTVKELTLCGSSPICGPGRDPLWQAAEIRAAAACTPGALAALLTTDLHGHLEEMRAGAERVAAALEPSFAPSVSVADPGPGEIVTPPGLPFDLVFAGFVAGVPHAGYVNSFEIDGEVASFDDPTGVFQRTVGIRFALGADLAVALKARTVLGTVSSTAEVTLDLGTLAPDVVITSPFSGTISPASAITVTGKVIGNLAQADVLQVGGQITTFDPATGNFARTVPLGSGLVQLVAADVTSAALGTTKGDSIVVLRGTPWPLDQRVPNAVFGRLNDSGLQAIESLVAGAIDEALSPSEFIGQTIADGTVCGFSTGEKTIQLLEAAGADTVELQITIHDFTAELCGVGPIDCNVRFDVDAVQVTAQGNLEDDPVTDDLELLDVEATALFENPTLEATGGLGFCNLAALLVEIPNGFQGQLPELVSDALADIDVGEAFSALGVDIDGDYDAVAEDGTGITFAVDANITALDPVPDAPVITHTLLPASASPPVLGPTIPSTSTPYDFGLCLTDGFVNRAVAAFMQQGRFNQSIATVPGTPFPLLTELLDVATRDDAYGDDCPRCEVTLALKPTAAAVARAPQAGENGTVTLIVPNYRVDVIVDDDGTPRTQLSALVTFTLPITLSASETSIAPSAGTLTVDNVRVIGNPIAADETKFANAAAELFPQATATLAGVFASIQLEPFEGLDLSARGSDYNVSCTALYMNLG
jgi:hypothetical protein